MSAAIIATTPPDDPETPLPTARVSRRRRLTGWAKRSPKMLIGLILLGIFVILAIIGPWIAPEDPNATGPLAGPPLAGSTVPSQLPNSHHWLGQTTIGGDILSQLLAGTRTTVFASFLAGILATALAVIIGIAAGYIGGWVDEVLSLFANVFLVIPALPLLIAIGAFLGPQKTGNVLVVSLIIAFTGLGVGGARAPRAGPFHAQPRLRGGGPHQR